MVLDIIFLVLSLAVGVSFVVFLAASEKYESYITPLDKKEYILPEIYGVGFRLIDLFKMEFKNRNANQIREHVIILYGERYADYYLRVIYAQKFSIVYLVAALGCALSALAEGTDKLLLLGLMAVMCVAVYYYLSNETAAKVKKRSEQFLLDFPNAVSTIALLVNSGMVLRDAWREVSMSEETGLHMEMRRVNEDMNNGMAEIDALNKFGVRCVTPEIKKFTALVVQGLEKGSRDLANALQNQSTELWELKKQTIIRKGELASSKLMIPLMIMFVGVLIMIIGPIMANFGI